MGFHGCCRASASSPCLQFTSRASHASTRTHTHAHTQAQCEDRSMHSYTRPRLVNCSSYCAHALLHATTAGTGAKRTTPHRCRSKWKEGWRIATDTHNHKLRATRIAIIHNSHGCDHTLKRSPIYSSSSSSSASVYARTHTQEHTSTHTHTHTPLQQIWHSPKPLLITRSDSLSRRSDRRGHRQAHGRNMRSRYRCSKQSAIHINSHSWLHSSSIHEPSDPPHTVLCIHTHTHIAHGSIL